MPMDECFGSKFILNGELLSSDLFDASLVYEGGSVYEVLRMVKGNPVFFYDHMERLETSLKIQGRKTLADTASIRKDIIRLIKAEKKKDINLKIVFNYKGEETNYLVYFIEPIYPSEEQYRNGVKGILFHAERADPESKVINHRLRSSIYHKLILEGAYEALLVNTRNEITEGSRSNIFFLLKGVLFTAPDNMVLNGITRKYILDICDENRIRVEFMCVRIESIHEYEAIFMTGTSPIVLPFNRIEGHFYNVKASLISRLRDLYIRKAGESISTFIRNI
jgi:branched-chain amino acid aminotransferase